MRNIVSFSLLLIIMSCNLKSSHEYLEESAELESKGHYSQAIKLLNEAINDNPRFLEAYLSRGADKSALKNYIGAINDYKKALGINPKNILANFNIGNNLRRLNQPLKAICYYNYTLKLKGGGYSFYIDFTPNNFAEISNPRFDVPGYEITYNRGLAFYDIDSLKRAVLDFSNSIRGGYQVGECYYNVGLIQMAYSNKSKACSCFTYAGRLGNKDAIKLYDTYCQETN